MSEKNPLDDIVDEMVVFRNENGTYFSNNPMWNDGRVRDRWIAKYSDEAKKEQADFDAKAEETLTEVEDDDVAYADMTNEDLRAELAGRGLGVDGKKAELIKRLEDDDAAVEE